MMALERRGSKVASISYWIPSNSTALPMGMAAVSAYIHLFYDTEMVTKDSPYEPLIQLDPCSCGSMMRGHLEQEVITDAFSSDI